MRDRFLAGVKALALLLAASPMVSANADHDELLQLFSDWRAFESPPLLNGAPDYTSARFDERQDEFLKLRDRPIGDFQFL